MEHTEGVQALLTHTVDPTVSASLHRMIWALLIAFAVTLVIGPWVIKGLRRLKIGQNVYELAPEEHQKKQGMPTMAGLMFAGVSIIVAIILRVSGMNSVTTDLVLVLILFALLNMAIGFADDFVKLRGKNNKGLSERQKLIPQTLVALLFSIYCYYHPLIGSSIVVPFAGTNWNLGIFYIPVMTFIIICTTNGSNLLDGLDGLLGSVTSVIAGFFVALIVLMLHQIDSMLNPDGAMYVNLQNIGVLMAALCGALLGYVRFNLYPAQMMMGDTGSMYLGGMVVGVAMVTRTPLLIPLVAGMYAASLLSVFIQRYYYRFTGGKRIFKMSPLHHHFELSGVKETTIVSMYTIVTVILCLIALLGVA